MSDSKRGPRPPSMGTGAEQRFAPTPPRSSRSEKDTQSRRTQGPKPPEDPVPSTSYRSEARSQLSQRPTKADKYDVEVSKKQQSSRTKKEYGTELIYDPNDPPTHDNEYHGRRASEILRGDDALELDLDELLWTPEHTDLFEEKPKTISGKIKLMYKRKVSEKRALPRLLLCALAVSLLWATSLAVCRGVMNSLLNSPDFATLQNTIDTLEAFVTTQSDSYKDCVDELFASCDEDFQQTQLAENARVSSEQKRNLESLKVYDGIKSICAANLNEMIEKIEEVSTTLLASDFRFGIPGCESIDSFARQQQNLQLAVGVAETTADASDEVVTTFNSQLEARIAYDLDYFGSLLPGEYEIASAILRGNLFNAEGLNQSLNTAIAEFEACLIDGTVDNGGEAVTCPDAETVQGQIDELLAAYEDDYDAAALQAQGYIDQAEEYIGTVDEFVARIEAIANQLPDGINFLNSDPWDIAGLDFADFEAAFFRGLGFLGISREDLEALRQQAVDEFNRQVDEHRDELEALEAEIQRLQDEFGQAIETDYDPPPIDGSLSTSLQNANESAQQLADQISEDLGFVREEASQLPGIDEVVSNANESAANLLTGLQNRSFDLFSYDDSLFLQFEANLQKFIDYAVTFDVVWRVLQSISLVRKYWKISGINTPPADVRSDRGALFADKKNPLQKISKLLTHPLVQMLYSAVWIGLLTLMIFLAYRPLYDQYVEGCVENDEVSIREDENM